MSSCLWALEPRPTAARLRRGAAARFGGIQLPARAASPERCTGGPAEGAEQRGAGSEAPKLGPETGRALRARWRVGGAGEGAWSRVSAARRRRNGRIAPYAAARLTGRARLPAGRKNAGKASRRAVSSRMEFLPWRSAGPEVEETCNVDHNESSKTDDASPKLMHHLRLPTC